ncbi:MAG TPA: ABC transporter permease subunit [Ktedonobacteraceae bacterium]|nr:ABC transporter permease subunit [Ktedonobacteraceae bacterium]
MATASVTIPKNLSQRKRTGWGAIITRTLINGRLPVAYGAFYAVLLAIIVGLIYPAISKLNLDIYLSSSVLTGILGTNLLKHLSGFTSLMAIELYSALYGLIFGGIIGYLAGAAIPATAENGTLDLALARPVSRTRYYLETWLGSFFAAILISVLTVVAVWIGSLFVSNPGIDWQWLIITQLIEFAFLFMSTGLGMLLGSFMDASRAAGGAAVGILFLFYMMNTLGGITDKLQWMLKIQPFYYAPGIQALVAHSVTAWYPWVLVIAGLILGLIGLVIFNKRDLPTT